MITITMFLVCTEALLLLVAWLFCLKISDLTVTFFVVSYCFVDLLVSYHLVKRVQLKISHLASTGAFTVMLMNLCCPYK